MCGNRHIVRVCCRTAFDIEDRIISNFTLERNVCRRASYQYPRQLLNVLEHAIDKRDPLSVLWILRSRQHHFHGEEIVRIESETDVLQSLETLHHQATAN